MARAWSRRQRLRVIAAACCWSAPVAAAVALGLFLVLPYYANGLHHVSLREVASGRHDPKDLWPYADGGLLGYVWAWGTLAAIALGPPAAGLAALAAVVDLFAVQEALRRTGRSLATLVLSAGVLAWVVSPMGVVLATWWLD